jgi:hypothetical protein
MTSQIDRKEAIRKFKEQKSRMGAYAVRCTTSGQVWVGSTRNLDANRNGSWFALRQGGHRDRSLQEEWKARGEQNFQYEILELLDPDVAPLAVSDLLKEKKRHWMAQLTALPLC